MNNIIEKHKILMDNLYSHKKHSEAVASWASFFAKNKEGIEYSNWRHLNKKRQNIEDAVWNRYISKGFIILDIGCGDGFFLDRLYSKFGDSVNYNGVDISSEAINNAKKSFNKAAYFCSEAEKLPFKNESFDYIQIISTLEHVIDASVTLREAYRVLKKNGYLYVVIHKNSIDPLIVATVYYKIKKLLNKKKRLKSNDYSKPLFIVKSQMFETIEELRLKQIEKRSLIPNMSAAFYRKLHIPLKFILWVGNAINNLPISIFKNLEYYLYQKIS
jgi:ubiquinone/menaquinone biosynthesis C-methylase UbiE